MFQHVFAEMNDMLDDIIKYYPTAQGTKKQELKQQWQMLKQMSDSMIEEWLNFEEKLNVIQQADFEQKQQMSAFGLHMHLPELKDDAFVKGQGYFKLCMYSKAIQQFDDAVQRYPDSMLVRIYMALSHLHLNNTEEACRHFKWIVSLTDNHKLLAIVYNALGCIQAKQYHLEKAKELFMLAHRYDPVFPEPLLNLEACLQSSGKLQYGSELASLM
ncbi:tetratricopeptide repeat protein [Paenibacillus sediminis]|uniref:Tetratricopeptide (TPR) repeat protein n=1 Tax=Paenibacillus sediminis TaxID=664909 RepID=A0ABS4H0B5_9BACL|nr:tetratricopeptide repeat protein [Paenibacillus sediminis]MBP1935802.1 tetratricopeptide (TPR) repeat protein [Paenibacillus sediminis]